MAFIFPILELLYNVNRKSSSLKPGLKNPTDHTAVRAGRWERKEEVCLGSSGGEFVRFQNYLA